MIALKVFLLGLISLPVFSYSQSIIVGNSGDGYLLKKNNEVWLRDMLEFNINESDDIVPNLPAADLDEILEKLDETFLNKLSINKLSLASRLKSLDLIHPILSTIFIDVILAYNWVVVDAELRPIFPVEDIFFISGVHVQIANRHGNTIRISKNVWDRMSDFNKNALVFHEVIYSLMKVRFNSLHDYHYQSSRSAREITGLLFSSHFKPNEVITKKLFDLFEIELELPFRKVSKNWVLKNPTSISFETYQAVYGPELRARVIISPKELICREYSKVRHQCVFIYTEHTPKLSF